MPRETTKRSNGSITGQTTVREILDGVPGAREVFFLHGLNIEALGRPVFLNYSIRLMLWRQCFYFGVRRAPATKDMRIPLRTTEQARGYYDVDITPLLQDLNALNSRND